MKKRNIALGLIASLIAVTPSTVKAEDCCLPEYRGGEPLCDDTACGIYTQYAGIQLNCGWNVFAWGEFLYWRPIRTDVWTTVRAENVVQGAPTVGSQQRLLAFNLGYRPAFRVGIGMLLPCFDDWNLNADYTWYHHDFTKTFTATAPSFLASTTAAGSPLVAPIYSSIRNKADLGYDIVGLNVQRPNYLGQSVILSPFLGMKWMRHRETFEQDCLNVFTGLIDSGVAKIHFDAIGLAAGFDGSWLLCWDLRLIGKADVALLYAYNRKFLQVINFSFAPTPPELTVNLRQHHKHVDILAKGGMGFGWGSYFCCNRYYVDLSATFDIMNDVVKLAFDNGMFEGPSTMFMGLTVRGQFDF